MENKIHIGYFDFWRGIAIVMVVAIHTANGLDFTSIFGNIRIVLRFLMNSAVPVFLALSSFFLSKKDLTQQDDCLKFWKIQIPKVYIPMLIWSIPVFFTSLLFDNASLTKSLLKLLFGGYDVFYFIILIIQCYVLLPLILVHKRFSLYISFLLIVLSWWAIIYKFPSLPLLLYAGPFTSWIFYFVLGVIISRTTKKNYPIIFPILLIGIGLILQYLESKYLYNLDHIVWGQKLTSIVSNSGIILLMLANKTRFYYKTNIIGKIFEFLGRHFFGIYLIHCYFIKIYSYVLSVNIWSIKCLCVLGSTLIFIFIIRNILPKYIGVKLFGLR